MFFILFYFFFFKLFNRFLKMWVYKFESNSKSKPQNDTDDSLFDVNAPIFKSTLTSSRSRRTGGGAVSALWKKNCQKIKIWGIAPRTADHDIGMSLHNNCMMSPKVLKELLGMGRRITEPPPPLKLRRNWWNFWCLV